MRSMSPLGPHAYPTFAAQFSGASDVRSCQVNGEGSEVAYGASGEDISSNRPLFSQRTWSNRSEVGQIRDLPNRRPIEGAVFAPIVEDRPLLLSVSGVCHVSGLYSCSTHTTMVRPYHPARASEARLRFCCANSRANLGPATKTQQGYSPT